MIFQIITKAINLNTNEVIYEGVKKEFDSYREAAIALKKVTSSATSRDYWRKSPSSYRITEFYQEDVHSYVSWRHCSSVRTTMYIKRIDDRK